MRARYVATMVVGLASCSRAPITSTAPRCPPTTPSVVETAPPAMPPAADDTKPSTLTDSELEQWLRGGCGPTEIAPEHSTFATIDPKLAKLPAPPSVFGTVKGTIVHARGGELWIVSADGQRRRRVKREASPEDDRTRAHWSPSGDALAFVTRHGDTNGRLVLLSPSCEWARVLGPADPTLSEPHFSADGLWLFQGSTSKPLHVLSGTRRDPPPCAGRCVEEVDDGGPWLRIGDAGSGKVDIAKPKWNAIELERAWNYELAPDGRTLYAFPRFRTTSETVLAGEKTLLLTDYSPIYRVRLPAKLPKTKTKPLVPEYFAPGFTPIRAGWLSVSPNGKYLFAVGENYVVADQPLADAQWISTTTAKTTLLGAAHKLIGARSWINDALWSPDSKTVLLTVAACAGEMSVSEPFCSDIRHELVVVDEKHAAFVALGSRASWSAADVLATPGG